MAVDSPHHDDRDMNRQQRTGANQADAVQLKFLFQQGRQRAATADGDE